MEKVDFLSTIVGLDVRFRGYADDLPADFTATWEYGDGEKENKVNLLTSSHTYEEEGTYVVVLKITNNNGGQVVSKIKAITVSDKVKTQLRGSIYELIDTYIPEDIFGKVPLDTKQQFIEKWQLYIQPLVNHEIPIEEFNNESYYEALENQLIMELAAYDYMVLQISLVIGSNAETLKESNSISSSETSETESTKSIGESGGVRRIQTGPTEVEFDIESEHKILSNVIKAMQPGGIIDILKQNLCMLAERLLIYLPICPNCSTKVVVPRVVNRRRPGLLKGPDPLYPVKKR